MLDSCCEHCNRRSPCCGITWRPATAPVGSIPRFAGDHATVLGSVTAAGGASQPRLDYGTTIANGKHTQATAVAPTANQQSISFPISGLVPDTSYHARITIVSQAGTVSNKDLAFTTISPPLTGTVGGGGDGGGAGSGTGRAGRPPDCPPDHPPERDPEQWQDLRDHDPTVGRLPTGQSCAAKVTLDVSAPVPRRDPKHRAKPTMIATAQISVAGGHHVKPILKLNRTGAKLPRQHHRLVTFTLTARDGASNTTRRSGHFLIKIKPSAQRHH
jgi:hypothetical protein